MILSTLENTKIIKEILKILGFRQIDGIDIYEFRSKFIENPIYIFHKELERLVNNKLIEIDLNQIKLTKKGLDFANLVWEEFV